MRSDADGNFDSGDDGLSIDRLIQGRATRLEDRDVFARTFDFTLPQEAKAAQAYPFYQPLERNDGPEAVIYGKRVLMLGSNNYLGLTRHPKVMEAAEAALQRFGTSMTGSRVLNGTMDLHEQLEERIARFLGKEAALVFTTGYQANLGAISALVGPGCAAVVDKADHASIYDGCRLSGGRMLRFRHNDARHLDAVLAGNGGGPTLVIVDGVYSMSGAVVDLPGVVAACRKHGARLLVDDAHAIGVLGEGGGAARGAASAWKTMSISLWEHSRSRLPPSAVSSRGRWPWWTGCVTSRGRWCSARACPPPRRRRPSPPSTFSQASRSGSTTSAP